MAAFTPELWAQTIIKMYVKKQLELDVNTPITYSVNTAQTKAETTFRIEACIKLYNQNTTPHRIVSAFLHCIKLSIDKVDLSEALVLGSNFTCQYAIRFRNNEMEFIANIESKMMAAELIT